MTTEHQRTLIREAVVALLVAANTAAADRVLPTRVEPHKKTQLPAISVYTLNDAVDRATTTEETHELQLEVALWVSHTDTLHADKAFDRLAKQVEDAMRKDLLLGGLLAEKMAFAGTTMEVAEVDGRSDPINGIAVLTYTMVYRSSIAADDPAEDFETVDATHNLQGSVTDTPKAEDTFTVQETP